MNELEIKALATELIETKKQIQKLLESEKTLKKKIMPFIKEQGAVSLEEGRVYYVESKGASTFSRQKVIEYLREGYGDALADQIDQECTTVGTPRQAIYIKLNNIVI